MAAQGGFGYQSYGAAASSPGMSNDEMQGLLQQERDRAAVQTVIAKLTDLCFEKCVQKPSSSLSRGEATCISNCTRMYLQTSMFTINRLNSSASAPSQ